MYNTVMMNLVWIVLLHLVQDVQSYCMGIGANPGFSGPPVVQQVDITTVLVSWEGLVTRIDCADQFVVKSGPVSSPSDYILSEMMPTSTFKLVIKERIPEIKYFYQVIAREEKGWNGVDYNKSPETLFTTSRKNGNLRPEFVPADPPKPVTQVTPQDSAVRVDTSNSPPSTEGYSRVVEYKTESPVSSLKNAAADESFVNENLVWIIIGALAAVLILAGLLYNIVKRARGKSVDLDSNIGRDDEDDDDWADEASEAGEELKSLHSQD